jgi:hypothetical protein
MNNLVYFIEGNKHNISPIPNSESDTSMESGIKNSNDMPNTRVEGIMRVYAKYSQQWENYIKVFLNSMSNTDELVRADYNER